MGTSYLFVEENIFPVERYGSDSENANFHRNNIGTYKGRLSPEMHVKVATASDQSLMEWFINGSAKSGRIECRDFEYEGSIFTLKFVDGICLSYSETLNPDSVMLPRLISICILCATLTYE